MEKNAIHCNLIANHNALREPIRANIFFKLHVRIIERTKNLRAVSLDLRLNNVEIFESRERKKLVLSAMRL